MRSLKGPYLNPPIYITSAKIQGDSLAEYTLVLWKWPTYLAYWPSHTKKSNVLIGFCFVLFLVGWFWPMSGSNLKSPFQKLCLELQKLDVRPENFALIKNQLPHGIALRLHGTQYYTSSSLYSRTCLASAKSHGGVLLPQPVSCLNLA